MFWLESVGLVINDYRLVRSIKIWNNYLVYSGFPIKFKVKQLVLRMFCSLFALKCVAMTSVTNESPSLSVITIPRTMCYICVKYAVCWLISSEFTWISNKFIVYEYEYGNYIYKTRHVMQCSSLLYCEPETIQVSRRYILKHLFETTPWAC